MPNRASTAKLAGAWEQDYSQSMIKAASQIGPTDNSNTHWKGVS